jgi:hypothetical protein
VKKAPRNVQGGRSLFQCLPRGRSIARNTALESSLSPLYNLPEPGSKQTRSFVYAMKLEELRLRYWQSRVLLKDGFETLPVNLKWVLTKHKEWFDDCCKGQSVSSSGLGVQPRHPFDDFNRILDNTIKYSLIYAIVKINLLASSLEVLRQIYVGQTDQWMPARWQGHFIDSFKHAKDIRQDKRYLYKEMSKCGYASFIMIPLQFVHDKDKFTELENYWMWRLNSVHPGGLNAHFEGLPRTPTRRGSQETVRRAHRSTDKVTNVQLSVGVSDRLHGKRQFKSHGNLHEALLLSGEICVWRETCA